MNAMFLETRGQSDWERIGFKFTSPPHDKETEDSLDLSWGEMMCPTVRSPCIESFLTFGYMWITLDYKEI